MAQNKLYLFARHARKPLQKIVDARPVFEILEQGAHGDARGLEQPLAADLPRHAFDRRTLAPIKHSANLVGAIKPFKSETPHRTLSSFCRQRTIFGIGVSGKLVFQLVTPTSAT